MISVYDTFHVKQVINASGKMTILGGSRVSEEVRKACALGAENFYEVKDLLDKTGAYIADLLGVESAYIVHSASSGIAQSVAASICQDSLYDCLHLSTSQRKREIVIAKGHNVDYGTPIEVAISLGGGILKEAGYANVCTKEHMEACISEQTAALVYVKSHHCVQKGMISIADMIALKDKYQLPLIIDAAAEEDLETYAMMGADVVVYSGTKALEGVTSGLLVGKRAFIELVKLQSKGIGRVMKVGKESILGLVTAITQYKEHVHLTLEEQRLRFTSFHNELSEIPGLQIRCVQDSAGRAIIRSELNFQHTSLSALQLAQQLKQGDIAIYTRDYRANEGSIEIDIRDVTDEELHIIAQRIKQLIKEGNKS